MSVLVISCGIGNVGAVRSMYRRLGVDVELIESPRPLKSGDRLVLPGVGSFDYGMRALRQHGFADFVLEAAAAQVPLLGICLGMQLLCRRSEEGQEPGLGLFPADVMRLNSDQAPLRIPHMGWNVVEPARDNPLLPPGLPEQRFYFTHSYRVRCDEDAHVWGTTDYGSRFPTVIGAGNLMGVQFHPEKSHQFGMALLTRFAADERDSADA